MHIRLNANVDIEQAKKLKHRLVDEGITFSQWLRKAIDLYLLEMEKPAWRDKGTMRGYLAKKGKLPKPEKRKKRKEVRGGKNLQ